MEKKIIKERIYVPFFDGEHKEGRNSNPNDALKQLSRNPAIVGLYIAETSYDLQTGVFSRSQWKAYRRSELPEMVRYDYYLLRKDQALTDALDSKPSHYFWDVFWKVATEEEPNVVGIVVQKVLVSPTGEDLSYDEPFVLRAFGQPCAEGEIPMSAGWQTYRK